MAEVGKRALQVASRRATSVTRRVQAGERLLDQSFGLRRHGFAELPRLVVTIQSGERFNPDWWLWREREWAVGMGDPLARERSGTMATSYEAVADRVAQLTKRQREILSLVPECGTSKLIASRIGIEPESVDKALQRAMKTLGAPNRAVAAAMLREHDASLSGKPDAPAGVGLLSGSRPVGETEAILPSEADRDPGRNTLFEARQPYEAHRPTMTDLLRRLLFDPGERHDLTLPLTIKAILLWLVGGLIAFSLLMAALAELSRAAHDLLPHGPI